MSDAMENLFNQCCETPGDINEHLIVLRALATECRRVTEFGIRHGTSACGLLSAIPRSYHGVDINEPGKIFNKAAKYAIAKGTKITVQIGSTLEVPPIPETDLLFIDTIHTYEQVAGELGRHAHKVTKKIAFHDTTSHPPVMDAVRHWVALFHDFWKVVYHEPKNNGFTVIERIRDEESDAASAGRSGVAT